MEHIIAKLLEDFEQGKMSRRQLIQSLALTAMTTSAVGAAPAAPADTQSVVKALGFNHVSFLVADYRKSRDFYTGLFGLQPLKDDGKECRLAPPAKISPAYPFGNNILVVRTRPSDMPASRVDHINFEIADWNADKPSKAKDALRAELKRRGIPMTQTDGGNFHIKDPDGLGVEMGYQPK